MKTQLLTKTDSIQELAHFWDKHDLTDFEDELEEVTEPVFEPGDGESSTRGKSSQTTSLQT